MAKPLNERQKDLYNFLVDLNGVPMTEKQLCDCLSQEPYNYIEYTYIADHRSFNATSARLTICNDIRLINDSDEVFKVIGNNSLGIFILNDENAKKVLEKEKINILKRLKRFYKKLDKVSKHNQLYVDKNDLTLNEIKSLLESSY